MVVFVIGDINKGSAHGATAEGGFVVIDDFAVAAVGGAVDGGKHMAAGRVGVHINKDMMIGVVDEAQINFARINCGVEPRVIVDFIIGDAERMGEAAGDFKTRIEESTKESGGSLANTTTHAHGGSALGDDIFFAEAGGESDGAESLIKRKLLIGSDNNSRDALSGERHIMNTVSGGGGIETFPKTDDFFNT